MIENHIYEVLLTLGASELSRNHFIDKWQKTGGIESYFGYSLSGSKYTFKCEPGRWYVTSYQLGEQDNDLIEANAQLERLRATWAEKDAA